MTEVQSLSLGSSAALVKGLLKWCLGREAVELPITLPMKRNLTVNKCEIITEIILCNLVANRL